MIPEKRGQVIQFGRIESPVPDFRVSGSFDFTRFRTDGPGGAGHPLPDFVLRRPDLRLAAGSPAIDIDPTPCDRGLAHDIAGVPRASGDDCDAGAHEYEGSGPRPFIRGRANGDATVDLSDMVFVLTYLFLGGSAPGCIDAADTNDDGGVDIGDPIFGLAALFLGGTAIPVPSEACGPDPTQDDLGCASSPDCP